MITGIDIAKAARMRQATGMLLVEGYPPEPMRTRILDTFPLARSMRVMFAWGKTIFAANGAVAGPEKIAHEAIHMIRQGDDVLGWWERYCADVNFRLTEEIPAHVAEYLFLCESDSSRASRRRSLATIAKALASPLYGQMLTPEKAKRLILDGASAAKSQGVQEWALAS